MTQIQNEFKGKIVFDWSLTEALQDIMISNYEKYCGLTESEFKYQS